MSKKNVMISIDEFIHKDAKSKMVNVSSVCEDALRLKTMPRKSDVPEQSLLMKCIRCDRVVEFGFMCELLNRFLCEDCEQINKCIHKDHEHIRIPRLNEV